MGNEEIQPIRAFPEELQYIINHYSESKGYPSEYFIVPMLGAISAAAGRTIVLRAGAFTSTGIIWGIVVGEPGLTKSEAQKDALGPLWKHQFNEIKRYESEIASCMDNPDLIRQVPKANNYILNDITPEAMVILLSRNPRGCISVYDELAKFVKSFNRYNNGGDEEMYLSLFNGDPFLRNRVDERSNAYAERSFLSITGGIQPAVLLEVFAGKDESGFFDRWLLSFPEGVKKPYPSAITIDPNVKYNYDSIIETLLTLTFRDYMEPWEMNYTPSSYKIVYDYQCRLIDAQNQPDISRTERGILAKMEVYLHRFALILQLCEVACRNDGNLISYVSDASASGAVLLCEYFLGQASKLRIKSIGERLTGVWKVIYDGITQEEFTRAYFIEVCKAHGIKQRTADYFLKTNSDHTEKRLFQKVRHGVFVKTL